MGFGFAAAKRTARSLGRRLWRLGGRDLPVEVPHLEIEITHRCNLTCDGCLYYSNYGHTQTYDIGALRRSMALWNRRLVPASFALLGGEPTLHDRLVEIVYMTREMWPSRRTRMELVTNALLLHRHPDLPRALAETRTALLITVHGDAATAPRYHRKVSRGLELARAWQARHGFVLDVVTAVNFERIYRGYGRDMAPYADGDPARSWDNCVTGQQCFQLFRDAIWKCAPLAYLPLQDEKYGLSAQWAPYLAYQPLRPGCTDDEIVEFFDRGAEAACGMCPVDPKCAPKPDPLKPVRFHERAQRAGGAPVTGPAGPTASRKAG